MNSRLYGKKVIKFDLSPSQVILIGTMHIDPKGEERLEKMLNHVKPDIITLESSPARREYSRKVIDELRKIMKIKQVDEESIDKLLSRTPYSPFEWRVCDKYGADHNVPVIGVDLPHILKQEHKSIEQSLGTYWNTRMMRWKVARINRILNSRERNKFRQQQLDSIFYSNLLGDLCVTTISNGYIKERDAHMYKEISKIKKFNPGKIIAFVGGWGHTNNAAAVRGKPRSLAYLLPHDKSFKINEADYL
ncbi:hypothetical protein HOK51_09135 [Candidatus Woesearchaeota archaeon]|jgi:hypothetical protein|nr:hypothetical protein [Candidatus Woesearchaeota archaeon]MBT6519993.1 hypothetical protein [Candidatus Woesearchaeota archaeon]MBT7367806.1 hypothetical protein [Candidatus Woesearchaeota archaeon]